MTQLDELLNETGVFIPKVLLPDNVDMGKWAVIACDQYTSEPKYWKDVENTVADTPSTFRLMLPEIFLEEPDVSQRYTEINKKMDEYINNSIFKSYEGLVYIERTLNDGSSRNGLLMCLDLEKYDYKKGSKTLIRATEGTIVDRLPPRVAIRATAKVEMPHILVFIDDPMMSVIEPISEIKDSLDKLYDFELMKNGHHIEGYGINKSELQERIITAIESLVDEKYKSKYNLTDDDSKMLFAMGDGNHSFASAKVHWENTKKEFKLTENDYHSARYALVEIVNIHNKGIVFKSIDRVVFNVDTTAFINRIKNKIKKMYESYEIKPFDNIHSLIAFIEKSTSKCQHIGFVYKNKFGCFIINNPPSILAHATITDLLDSLYKEEKFTIDYIHGEDIVVDLCSKENNIGFLLPAIDKNCFFETVIKDGSLPKKTFSMGDANEKRYYLECRGIVG